MTPFGLLAMFLVTASPDVACHHVPEVIEQAYWVYDGGTVTIAVTDSLGCRVVFCIDHRMKSGTWGRVYVGGDYPTKAHLANDDELQQVADLALRALDKAYPRIVQREFLRMPQRGPIPEDEYRAWLVLHQLLELGIVDENGDRTKPGWSTGVGENQ